MYESEAESPNYVQERRNQELEAHKTDAERIERLMKRLRKGDV